VGGGQITAVGTPEQIAEHPDSYTGHYLKRLLSVQHEQAS
jgi:excinuclease ABC subunit A